MNTRLSILLSLLLLLFHCGSLLAAPLPPLPPKPGAPASSSRSDARLPALTVLSIIPAQGEPGMTVTLNGSGFTPQTSAFLGATEIRTAVVGDKILTLVIPDLQPGVYALYLRREDGATSRPYNFSVQPVRPEVSSLAPEKIDACAVGREREVVVNGLNFKSGAQVVFDGGGIATRYLSPEAVAFVTPQLPSGLHQVLVKNPSGAASDALALVIDSKPEISSVSIGTDYVSYYELVITGRNFQQRSTLVVDGARIHTAQQTAIERESIIFAGCSQLIYQRHPYDSTPKDIRMQVINPNGEESGVVIVTAP